MLSALPTSSWPSITSLIPTGGRPSQARSAPTWASTFAFESAELPRPKIAPSRSVASNGGDSSASRRRPARRRSGRTGGRSARQSAPAISAGDHRRGVRQFECRELLDSGLAQHPRDGVVGVVQRGPRRLRVARRRDGRNPHERPEIVFQLGHERRNRSGGRRLGDVWTISASARTCQSEAETDCGREAVS